MEMTFTLGQGARVDGHTGPFTIATDQPPDASAPTPFTLFLASIGACAAFYVQAFCRKRDIPVDGVRVSQRSEAGPTGLVERVHIASNCHRSSRSGIATRLSGRRTSAP